MLLFILPTLTVALATWDGIRQGFSLLWLVMPLLCFLTPMYMFFNDSALIYGFVYSTLAIIANSIGAALRRWQLSKAHQR